ncbi:MAG TPA: succinate dehydrogenase assembly factor 2 [Pseudomonadales bacterium]
MNDTKTTLSDADLKRLYWHSRRGMLELDLILVPFAEHALPQLAEAEVQMYRELLAEEDQDLFMWLTRRADAPTPRLQRTVDLVLAARTRTPR